MAQDPKSEVRYAGLQIVFPELGYPSDVETKDRTSPSEAPGDGKPQDGISVESLSSLDHRPEPREGGVASQSSTQRKQKWYSLIDKVYAKANLEAAWERVYANRGAPGIDGMSVRKFAEEAPQRLEELSEDLRRKTYRPQAVRRVYIPKSGGGKRPLGIPTVRDRIVQQALHQVLSPIFETEFSPRSHGFRPEKGCHTALLVVDQAIKAGYAWVVDADIQAFFDTVDHDRLIAAVNEEVSDGSVLKLIRLILEAGVVEPETSEVEPTELGTPQGGPVSPLLANIYLHAFDRRMVAAGCGLVRYADDFVIFAKSEDEAKAALDLARCVLEDELGLQLHPEKTRVVSVTEGFEFLGYHYFRSPKTSALRKAVRRKSVQRFRDAIRARTPRLRNQRKPKAKHLTLGRLKENAALKARIGSLNRYLEGWFGYFKSVSGLSKFPYGGFDEFVRRRMRSTITGRTGNGWWTARITNEWFHQLGLLSLNDDLHREYQAAQGNILPRGAFKGKPRGSPLGRGFRPEG
jgi:RNA-directed DNA polymerase